MFLDEQTWKLKSAQSKLFEIIIIHYIIIEIKYITLFFFKWGDYIIICCTLVRVQDCYNVLFDCDHCDTRTKLKINFGGDKH